jgi:hypothetical protein
MESSSKKSVQASAKKIEDSASKASKKGNDHSANKISIDKSDIKRPKNAYLWFCAEKRQEVEAKGFKGKDIMSELGRIWSSIDPDEKVKYNEMHNLDKVRYEKDLEDYGLLEEDDKEHDDKENHEKEIKRPLSGYLLFSNHYREEVSRDLSDPKDVMKELARRWNECENKEREKFEKMAEKEKEKYEKIKEELGSKNTSARKSARKPTASAKKSDKKRKNKENDEDDEPKSEKKSAKKNENKSEKKSDMKSVKKSQDSESKKGKTSEKKSGLKEKQDADN